VVSEESVDTGSDGLGSILACSLREVPKGSGTGKDELSRSNDEGVEPKKPE